MSLLDKTLTFSLMVDGFSLPWKSLLIWFLIELFGGSQFLFYIYLGLCLKCYNDGEEQIVKCDENLGYRTCFIRYNESEFTFRNGTQPVTNHLHSPEGGITGRGCSTKDKVYYKECETNSYGEGTEKFCYCNFYLCNGSMSLGPPSHFLLTVIVAILSSALELRWETWKI